MNEPSGKGSACDADVRSGSALHNTDDERRRFRAAGRCPATMASNDMHDHNKNDDDAAAAPDHDDDFDAMFANCGYPPQELSEVMRAERDVLGSQQQQQEDQHSNDKQATAAAQGLQEALAMLPEARRAAWEHAATAAPAIVAAESPPERFLSSCQYNFWKAAEQMALYWEKRQQVFGPDRFCKPLTLLSKTTSEEGGNGNNNNNHLDSALSPTAIQIIQSGVFLHIDTVDTYGREIFIFDRQFIDPLYFEQFQARIEALFYMLHVLSESPRILQNGFIMMVVAETKKVQCTPCADNFRLAHSGAVPILGKGVHIISFKDPSLVQRSLNSWLSALHNWKYMSLRLRMHAVTSVEELVEELQEFGLSAEHLPQRYGGAIDHNVWFQERLEIERKRYNQQPTMENVGLEQQSSSDLNDNDDDSLASSSNNHNTTTEMNIDELKDMCEEMTEKCLVAKLEREQQALLKQQELLTAQIVCATHIGRQYDYDRSKIHSYLKTLFARVIPTQPEIPPEYLHDDQKLTALVDDVLKYYLLYLGRDSVTHQFMFLRTEFPMPDSVRREMDQLQRTLPGMTTQILEGRTQLHREQEQQQEEEEEERNQASAEDPIDAEISSLRAKIQTLEYRNNLLRGDQSFLESSQVFAEHSVQNFNQYREQNRQSLTNHLSRTLSIRHQYNPSAVADWLLDRLTWFLGQTTITPSLTVAHMLAQNLGGQQQPPGGNSTTTATSLPTGLPGNHLPNGTEEPMTLPQENRDSLRGSSGTRASPPSSSGRQERQQKVHRRRKKNLKRL